MNAIDSFRTNLSLKDEGLIHDVGLYSYLKKLSFRRRTETMRMLLVIGFLMIHGKLHVSGIADKPKALDSDNINNDEVNEALSQALVIVRDVQ